MLLSRVKAVDLMDNCSGVELLSFQNDGTGTRKSGSFVESFLLFVEKIYAPGDIPIYLETVETITI
jgi:hypothetical protein